MPAPGHDPDRWALARRIAEKIAEECVESETVDVAPETRSAVVDDLVELVILAVGEELGDLWLRVAVEDGVARILGLGEVPA